MAQDSLIARCPQCGVKNRIPAGRTNDQAVCGRCKSRLPLSVLFPEHRVDVTDATFQREILDFPGPSIVFFWATWCVYCRQLMPVFDELSRQFSGRIKFARIIMDQNEAMASHYNVLSAPTLILFKGGREANRLVGALPKEQLEYHLRALL